MSKVEMKKPQPTLATFFTVQTSKKRKLEEDVDSKQDSSVDMVLSLPGPYGDLLATLNDKWKAILLARVKKDVIVDLVQKLNASSEKNTIFPPKSEIFNAVNNCPLENVRVVVLGQDPYHGKCNTTEGFRSQAHGFAFGAPDGAPIPPSLNRINKELSSDLKLSEAIRSKSRTSPNLTPWANQGVLLLNDSLTVVEAQPASHQDIGWKTVTNSIIKYISDSSEHVVFMLWGKHAQTKEKLIDGKKHLILKAVHPSPMTQGFLGCGHFSKCNEYLTRHGKTPIDW